MVTLAERKGGVNTFFDIFLNENATTDGHGLTQIWGKLRNKENKGNHPLISRICAKKSEDRESKEIRH
jgi:hypothetical protein